MSGVGQVTIRKIGQHFRGEIYVPPMLLGWVIGRGGRKLRELEAITSTVVTVPRRGARGDGGESDMEQEPIVVAGQSEQAVREVLERLGESASEARRGARDTHFAAVRLQPGGREGDAGDGTGGRFALLRDELLLKYANESGINEDLFQKEHTLHLTLGTMILADKRELEHAVEIIKNKFRSDNEYLFSGNMQLHLRGLGCFGNDPKRANVLYAQVYDDLDRNRLLTLANKLQEFLFEEKIIPKKHNSINLHMTIMKSRFLKNNFQQDTKRKSIKFDCSNILKEYADFDLGLFNIKEVELLKIGSSTDIKYYDKVEAFEFTEKATSI